MIINVNFTQISQHIHLIQFCKRLINTLIINVYLTSILFYSWDWKAISNFHCIFDNKPHQEAIDHFSTAALLLTMFNYLECYLLDFYSSHVVCLSITRLTSPSTCTLTIFPTLPFSLICAFHVHDVTTEIQSSRVVRYN